MVLRDFAAEETSVTGAAQRAQGAQGAKRLKGPSCLF
jgi:hypothetical protein